MTEVVPLILRLLAVAGGAALGWLAVSFVVGIVRRFLGVSSVPRPPLLVARALGAVVAGWVVWLWVFGHGGSGVGGPGGFGIGGAPGTGKGTQQDQPRPTPAGPAKRSDTMSVVILGGTAVQQDRFYQLPGETKPLTLKELQDLIRQRQASGLKGIEIIITDESVAKESLPVTALEKWARDHELTVSLLLPDNKAP